jgi:streptogramin lyase
MTASASGTLWAALNSQNAIVRITPDGTVKEFPLPAAPKPTKAPSAPGLAAFEFVDSQGDHYQLFTRSTYGAYGYVGAILRNRADIVNLQPDGTGYRGIVRVVASDQDCFAAVRYRNLPYCVPAAASNTKQLFALLHQLQQLATAPSNAPTTLTVTAVP